MPRFFSAMLVLLWIVALVAGFNTLQRHTKAPGRPAVAPRNWPTQSTILPASDTYTLILVAHPHCPCTRATLNELARLMALCGTRLTAYVLFFCPRAMPSGWEVSDLYAQAARIHGVHVISDANGVEARRFGAYTSGQTLLYDAQGTLLFSGGITISRGHEGDSLGKLSVLHRVFGERTRIRNTPVFGCSLTATSPF